MSRLRLGLAAAALALAAALPAQAAGTITIYKSQDPGLELKTYAWEGGKSLRFTHGVGSAAFRHPQDPPNEFHGLGDRGPNFACGEVKAVTGLEMEKLCKGRDVRIYPVPDYRPSIYRILLREDGTFSLAGVIPLKDRDGRPLTGLPNPLTAAAAENAVDGRGNPLPPDPGAVDAEGLVRLRDGTFWIGEENAPSILHAGPDGRVLKRIVPAGSERDFAGANYPVEGGLPAILARRQGNRGIESMALSPDERFLYFMLQSPLANPDARAFARSRNTRILKFDLRAGKVVGQYVYRLDDPRTFRKDPSESPAVIRVSEAHALGPDRLLVLERTDKTTKLHEADLRGATDILGSKWDDPAARPTLEQSDDLAAAGVIPVRKTLRWDSADHPEAPGKIEGMAFLGDGSLLLINDNDFGIAGEETLVLVLRGHGIRRE
ncbi:MAG: esterase-like activity of phytase family protein [Candidatus Tectomicrobia bacterium]|uniref:Esterase-like activity of phytase family protein n=1 Tax=Tectimicrobiota bacterium TaxID=2528274 RepID=A0A932MMA3_UNCTE|nr:esterase-like activity of phytase family protein [Candidatus Tectomicrobia bacterium]